MQSTVWVKLPPGVISKQPKMSIAAAFVTQVGRVFINRMFCCSFLQKEAFNGPIPIGEKLVIKNSYGIFSVKGLQKWPRRSGKRAAKHVWIDGKKICQL